MKKIIIAAISIASTLFGMININPQPAQAGYSRCERGPNSGSYCFRLGDRGPLIYDFIEELRDAGYYRLRNDSYFGPVTERGVKQFQRDNQLFPDGIAGPQTRNLLRLRNQQRRR